MKTLISLHGSSSKVLSSLASAVLLLRSAHYQSFLHDRSFFDFLFWAKWFVSSVHSKLESLEPSLQSMQACQLDERTYKMLKSKYITKNKECHCRAEVFNERGCYCYMFSNLYFCFFSITQKIYSAMSELLGRTFLNF